MMKNISKQRSVLLSFNAPEEVENVSLDREWNLLMYVTHHCSVSREANSF